MVGIDVHDGSEHVVFEDAVTTQSSDNGTKEQEKETHQDTNHHPIRYFIDGTCDKFWRYWIPIHPSPPSPPDVLPKSTTSSSFQHQRERYSLLYLSEMSGFNHIYVANWVEDINNEHGNGGYWISKQLTKGNFVVFDIIRVILSPLNQTKSLSILFSAGGVIKGQNPYYHHLCRLDLTLDDINENSSIHSSKQQQQQSRFSDVTLPMVLKVLTHNHEEEVGEASPESVKNKGISDSHHEVILSKTGNVFIDIASRLISLSSMITCVWFFSFSIESLKYNVY